MGGLDPAKLLVILVLALVLLGPERLPKAARQIGSFWRDVNRYRERLEQEVRDALPDIDLPEIPTLRRGGVTNYLTGMMRDSEQAGAAGSDPAQEAPAGLRASSAAAGEASSLAAQGGAAGVPAGWHARGAEAPGFASGSLLSRLPSGTPEGFLAVEVRLDLDDPSWN